MSRRYVSLWLPDWPTDRMRLSARRCGRAEESPLALVLPGKGGLRVVAVDAAARAAGIRPGLLLADARAVHPGLQVRPAEPEADARALRALAVWCGRYSPWTAPDGTDGVVLDITGCAHLFGGERALLEDLGRRLRRLGIGSRAAVADSPAAAWAFARYGTGGVLAPGRAYEHLAGLPVAALRIDPEVAAGLSAMGIRRIGELAGLAKGPLLSRFGPDLLTRLDQALGGTSEPIAPLHPRVPLSVRLTFVDAIGRAEDVEAALADLLLRLVGMLEREGKGARRLALELYRIDGEVARIAVATGRATRDAAHLERLLAERLDGLDLGFGIEVMILEALEAEALVLRQAALAEAECCGDALAHLADRLANRLGSEAVLRLAPVQSHIPERAEAYLPANGDSPLFRTAWALRQPRPLRLLPEPEPIEAMAELPDAPPVWFRWRAEAHRVAAAFGPERIAPEWWRKGDSPLFPEERDGPFLRTRDYYRLEDQDGARFWVFRAGLYGDGPPPRWYLHGLFG